MKPPFGRLLPSGAVRAGLSLPLTLALLAGCATNRPVEQALLAHAPTDATSQAVEQYHIECPDVLEVTVDLRPDIPASRRTVGPDGCIDMGLVGRVRVEGQVPSQAAAAVAAASGVPSAAVRIRVVGFNSQQVYVFGQVAGLQRAVPYHGPETIRDFMQRAGGISGGAEPTAVHVIRANVAEGKQPEVFSVDLKAIVMRQDEHTNVRLEPFDQVFVGETRQSSYEKTVPPLLRPLYEALVNIERPEWSEGGKPERPDSGPVPAIGPLARQ